MFRETVYAYVLDWKGRFNAVPIVCKQNKTKQNKQKKKKRMIKGYYDISLLTGLWSSGVGRGKKFPQTESLLTDYYDIGK